MKKEDELTNQVIAYIESDHLTLLAKPRFHFSAPKGWINDPNGLVYIDDRYYLSYQYNPLENYWNNIAIGRSTSHDLLSFDFLDVALYPNKSINGIFSGSSILIDEKIYQYYTRHHIYNGVVVEEIALTISDSLYRLINYGEVIIKAEDVPFLVDNSNFRDPFIYQENEHYFLFVASRNLENNRGIILVFISKDAIKFRYHTFFDNLTEDCWMYECPSFAKIANKYVLSYSYIDKGKNHSSNRTEYVLLKIDLSFPKEYQIIAKNKFDFGLDFYAPQIYLDKNKQPFIFGWVNDWVKKRSQKYHLNFEGVFTFPRYLSLKGSALIQTPPILLESEVKDIVLAKSVQIPTISHLILNIFPEIRLKFIAKDEVNIFQITKKYLAFNEAKYFAKLSNSIRVDIYLDRSIIEIYINKGEIVFSSRYFPFDDIIDLEFDDIDNLKSFKLLLLK